TGGEGYPEDIDIDAFNEREMEKLQHRSVEELLADLKDGRTGLIEWVEELSELELDREGRHPVLGVANVETVIFSIYAHQLLHMREMAPKLRK
ncbi:MAG: DinB family protein, partial [Anaerolineales bacterium]